MSIYDDIIEELSDDSTISNIVSSNIFQRKPIEAPNSAYITFSRTGRERNIVSNGDKIRFFCFSKDMEELENLSEAIIVLLDGKQTTNDNFYLKIRFLSQNDEAERLEDGFYYNVLHFEFVSLT